MACLIAWKAFIPEETVDDFSPLKASFVSLAPALSDELTAASQDDDERDASNQSAAGWQAGVQLTDQ